jgi:hypothetical protein
MAAASRSSAAAASTNGEGGDDMAVRIRPITLWRAEVDHQPGMLAQTLEPLASAGADLQAVMGYRLPGGRGRAAIEVFPVTGAKSLSAAQMAGLSESGISAVQVEGDNREGLGHATAKALAAAGINIDFFLALVSGKRYTTVIGFDNPVDAERAIPLIKRATTGSHRARRPRAAKRASAGARRRTRRTARR